MPTRDPLYGQLVTVFGGSGFIGIHLAQQLLERGARLRVASRHPEEAWSLKPLANLGQLQFVRCNVLDERNVRACVDGAYGVVNLVGSFEGNLEKLMGDAAGMMARAAKEAGARAFVEVSAIGADIEAESEYAYAKGLGEEKVRAAFPEATIMRPSVVFGEDGGIVKMFADLIQMMPALPVFAPEAPMQLVHVDDVAEGITAALVDPGTHGGKIYELAGPEKVTMMQLNRRIAEAQRRKRLFAPMPDAVGSFFSALPGSPMGPDQWKLLKAGNVASGQHPGLAKLGVEPKPLSLFLDRMMVRYRKHGRFADRTGIAPGTN
ncbi:NAD(P)H-binding protein [Erythrobacter sp. 3-20A1M]|uniref:complex I NDUFA9 subunit family protein n=1 Tax=Erythrobacter sp. 3-20A1M TaxID=2653850 RepID=UPI001BFCBC78|nr:complex I NDUFA9 subunit family protein [Erythrobacter sp. 3-20A1M]QWC57251.1 NAD(P)H-binding protein [Erythrobacter sp. 3-20A1M]